jgi:hypothetical protein
VVPPAPALEAGAEPDPGRLIDRVVEKRAGTRL